MLDPSLEIGSGISALTSRTRSAFEADPPIVGLKPGACGTDDGREFIDAIGGAIVSGLGYGNETVRAAMHASIDRLDFWPVLHGTTPAALRLARRLAELSAISIPPSC